jgi:hypothetical protein
MWKLLNVYRGPDWDLHVTALLRQRECRNHKKKWENDRIRDESARNEKWC